jgi:hypothetical protein
MDVSTEPGASRRHGRKRSLGRTFALAASLALALAVATPAWATVSATGTLAPIGSGSYLLTFANTGSETITGLTLVPIGFSLTSVAPSPACQLNTVPVFSIFNPGASVTRITCSVTVAPATSTQLCYSGYAWGEAVPSAFGAVTGSADGNLTISMGPAVTSCPLPGFIAGSASTPGTGGTTRSSGTPGSSSPRVTSSQGARAGSHGRCRNTYKAWSKKHRHATRSQKKAEAKSLHEIHGCPLAILK